MSVYSNTEIMQAVADGVIVCTPFHSAHVAEASLDFTLGHYFYKQEFSGEYRIYNPFDEAEVARYFKGPLKAMSHGEWCVKHGYAPLKNIPADHPVIVLRPGERILAHTHEFVGIRAEGGAAQVLSRSTWGRNGVAVCFDAGWIDPGYINRITLEIYNLNMHESVVLPVGERIGQLVFHKAGPVEGGYGSGVRGLSDKYQTGDDLEEIIASWRPEMMLPKAYRDQRVRPAAIDGLSEGLA
ncbi:MAG: deoxycytidine triphosphate deaminase [Candidatus Saccharibacteria bacterium]|nr:deoxycytidine triphosphate deaminase [Candidatus Saccharibacteria bacterium]